LVLLLRESRLEIFALLFDFAVLFEGFIEQHYDVRQQSRLVVS
jgi:5-methylcytosine-specific restriction endonuclease McrBC regulatory subunit McrC